MLASRCTLLYMNASVDIFTINKCQHWQVTGWLKINADLNICSLKPIVCMNLNRVS